MGGEAKGAKSDSHDSGSGERRKVELSDDQLERVAVRAAEIVWQNFTLEVGKVTIRTCLHVVWIICASAVLYLWVTEKIKIPNLH